MKYFQLFEFYEKDPFQQLKKIIFREKHTKYQEKTESNLSSFSNHT